MGDDMEVPSEWGNGLGEDETDEGVLDYYLDVQVMFPQADDLNISFIIGINNYVYGEPVGVKNSNPRLDTCVYTVSFDDSRVQYYSANIISEDIYSHVDSEGRK